MFAGMLHNEFEWLEKLGIAIPLADNQTSIINARSGVAHEGYGPDIYKANKVG